MSRDLVHSCQWNQAESAGPRVLTQELTLALTMSRPRACEGAVGLMVLVPALSVLTASLWADHRS